MRTEWLEALTDHVGKDDHDPSRIALVQQLSREVGVELLRPAGEGYELTPAGEAYAARARGILHSIAEAGAAGLAIAEGRLGELRLGLCEEVATPRLSEFLINCRTQNPGIWWKISEEPPARLIAALKRHDVDAVLMPQLPLATLESGLVVQTIWEEPWSIMLPPGHALARLAEIGPDDLRGVPVIAIDPSLSPSSFDLIRKVFAEKGIVPNIVANCLGRSTISTLVSSGVGVAFVPRSPRVSRAPSDQEINERPFRAPPMQISCICNIDNPPGVSMQFLRTMMSAAINQPPPPRE